MIVGYLISIGLGIALGLMIYFLGVLIYPKPNKKKKSNNDKR